MVISGRISGGVATEKDLSSVVLERVVKRVELLRRDEIPRHEHIRSIEHLRRHHLLLCCNYTYMCVEMYTRGECVSDVCVFFEVMDFCGFRNEREFLPSWCGVNEPPGYGL